MNEVVPRSFFKENMQSWNENGYDLIDFSRVDVDLSHLPPFYNDTFKSTDRKIEKNYLLNYLLINNLAYYKLNDNKYMFHARESMHKI